MGTNEIPARNEPVQNDIIRYLAPALRQIVQALPLNTLFPIQEIRLRADKPFMLQGVDRDWLVDAKGALVQDSSDAYTVNQEEIAKTLELMSQNSLYAYQEDIRNGFLTLRGGHRVGVVGKVVVENSNIRSLRDIAGMNIRIARQIPGCASKVIPYIINQHKQILNTLIISPPQCGKTTLLRDVARMLSNGVEALHFPGVKVGIVDERSEIAACFRGVPQNDVGLRTDVLDGCPKASGMSLLLRSMSPQVIITDEIGGHGDREAVMQMVNAGIKIITTAHGYNLSELKTRQEVLTLMQERVFEKYIVLNNSKGPGTIAEILEGSMQRSVS